jgi:hypothetical protein
LNCYKKPLKKKEKGKDNQRKKHGVDKHLLQVQRHSKCLLLIQYRLWEQRKVILIKIPKNCTIGNRRVNKGTFLIEVDLVSLSLFKRTMRQRAQGDVLSKNIKCSRKEENTNQGNFKQEEAGSYNMEQMPLFKEQGLQGKKKKNKIFQCSSNHLHYP